MRTGTPAGAITLQFRFHDPPLVCIGMRKRRFFDTKRFVSVTICFGRLPKKFGLHLFKLKFQSVNSTKDSGTMFDWHNRETCTR
jgi:hypothetical protein